MSFLISCSGKKEENKELHESLKNAQNMTLSIDKIENKYFLAQLPWPSPNKYKVFAKLGKEYCVGDYVDVYYKEIKKTNNEYDEIEALDIKVSNFKLEPEKDYKPVIYLYPTKKINVTVTLDYNGVLTHTYPNYSNAWNVTAYPNGTIVDKNGIEYPYLFWEGNSKFEYDLTKGFCIPGDRTEDFLRDKLSYMGLNKKEIQDFTSFWVPFMKQNPYNRICFQSSNYTENAKLLVSPQPDSLLRVYMVFQPLNHYEKMEEQKLRKFNRKGFAVVEWGGRVVR